MITLYLLVSSNWSALASKHTTLTKILPKRTGFSHHKNSCWPFANFFPYSFGQILMQNYKEWLPSSQLPKWNHQEGPEAVKLRLCTFCSCFPLSRMLAIYQMISTEFKLYAGIYFQSYLSSGKTSHVDSFTILVPLETLDENFSH